MKERCPPRDPCKDPGSSPPTSLQAFCTPGPNTAPRPSSHPPAPVASRWPKGQEEAIRGSFGNPQDMVEPDMPGVTPRVSVPSCFSQEHLGCPSMALRFSTQWLRARIRELKQQGRVSLSLMWRKILPVPTCQPPGALCEAQGLGKGGCNGIVWGRCAMRKP